MTQEMDSITKKVLERLAENPVKANKVYSEEIRYCWVDTDDQRVSPVHKDFGKALSWISNWPDNFARLQRWKDGDPKQRWSYSEESIEKLERSISLTGKPPFRLMRVVIRTIGEPIADFEQAPVDAAMKSSGLR